MVVRARQLEIVGRREARPPHDCGLITGDETPVDVEQVVGHPDVTLYWLDLVDRQALFVETPPGVGLWQAPFLYAAQHRHAVKLYAVPFDQFEAVAATMPPPGPVLFLHSTGRCGSTLLWRLLRSVQDVFGISEPDVFTQLLALRDGRSDEVVRLADSCVRMLVRHAPGAALFKLRSQATHLVSELAAAVPGAIQLFLYRNAEDVLRSYALALAAPDQWQPMDRAELERWVIGYPTLRRFLDQPGEVTPAQMLALRWIAPVRHYVESWARGSWAGAVRYEHLIADPVATTAAICAAYGLRGTVAGDDLRAVLDADAQAGSHVSRDVSERRRAAGGSDDLVRAALVLVDDFLARDIVLPGTLAPGAAVR